MVIETINTFPGPATAGPTTRSLKTHPPATMSFGCYRPGLATRAPHPLTRKSEGGTDGSFFPFRQGFFIMIV
jgi:hypothetical protein